jgi:hypothetical protein
MGYFGDSLNIQCFLSFISLVAATKFIMAASCPFSNRCSCTKETKTDSGTSDKFDTVADKFDNEAPLKMLFVTLTETDRLAK